MAKGRRVVRKAQQGRPRLGVGAWLFIVLLGIPIGVFFNLVAGAGLLTGAVWSIQSQLGHSVSGWITDSAQHTVRSRRGPDERYCYGIFAPADGSPSVRVRVYVSGSCRGARDRMATYVPAVGSPVSNLISDPSRARVGEPMPFNGLFGMTPGAVVDAGAFWTGLWPFGFLIPFAAAIDVLVGVAIRDRVRWRRAQDRDAKRSGSHGAG